MDVQLLSDDHRAILYLNLYIPYVVERLNHSQPIIGVSWDDEKLKELDVRLEDENTLYVRFEASTFQEDASREIEVRLSTPLARDLLKQIERYAA